MTRDQDRFRSDRRGTAPARPRLNALAMATVAGAIMSPACAPPPPADLGPFHDPTTVMPSTQIEPRRGWRTTRGIVHSHSPYSHDACDGEPYVDGVRNEACFADCRRGPCETRQDFVFLTDHSDLFAEHPFPDVLLHAPGDTLLVRDGQPVANWIACEDGHRVLVTAGTESGMMPIGLERHVAETVDERYDIYDAVTPEAVQAFRDAGALVFLQHTEGWEFDQILELDVDGIEMYNLHQNMMENMGDVVTMVLTYVSHPDEAPIPELGLIAVFEENQIDLTHWAKASVERRLPAVLASDAHQNVFNDPTYDGERLDSFRRLMHWFSNYLLIPEESEANDRVLKEAIAEGRLYGAFDYLGNAEGFDFHAEAGGEIYEMGAATAPGPATLRVTTPRVYRLDPTGPAPEIRARLLRAEGDGWTEVASGAGELRYEAEPGAYRAEVRMVPHHLTPWLGRYPEDFLRELIWIYSNPIYVGADRG